MDRLTRLLMLSSFFQNNTSVEYRKGRPSITFHGILGTWMPENLIQALKAEGITVRAGALDIPIETFNKLLEADNEPTDT